MTTLKQEFEYTPELDDLVLQLFEEGVTSTQVAVSLGITLSEFEEICQKNKHFARVCHFGQDLARAKLEHIALEGAQGKLKNFNGTMVQFLLKTRYPDTYNDKRSGDNSNETLLEQLTAGSLKIVRDNEQQ